MTRAIITLKHEGLRGKLLAWAGRVPVGWRIEFKEPKRSDDQNDRFWELLGRVSKRMEVGGRKYRPDQWKCIFMKAMGEDVEFLPTLDGTGFFPSGFRSSDLTVREMCDLQTFIEAHCAEKGVDIWGNGVTA